MPKNRVKLYTNRSCGDTSESSGRSPQKNKAGATRSGRRQLRLLQLVSSSVAAKVEQIHQIADGRTVQWNVGMVAPGVGVREVVAAAVCQRRQSPVGLDELQNRDVVGVSMRDVARTRPR